MSARERVEAVIADLKKYDEDCDLARSYGGPTMLPRHPIDEGRARQMAADLRELLAEITRLRSLVDEARGVVERLANAADVYGVANLDTDDLDEEATELQDATLAARSLLNKMGEA